MSLGNYRHLVTIEKDVGSVPNALGEVVASWQEAFPAFAEILPLTGRELAAAKQAEPRVSGRIRLRADRPVHPGNRVRQGDRVWNILAVVNEEERDVALLLDVEEVVAPEAV